MKTITKTTKLLLNQKTKLNKKIADDQATCEYHKCAHTKNMLLLTCQSNIKKTKTNNSIFDVKNSIRKRSHQLSQSHNNNINNSINKTNSNLNSNHWYANCLAKWRFDWIQKRCHFVIGMILLMVFIDCATSPTLFAQASLIKSDDGLEIEQIQHLILQKDNIVYEKYSQDRDNSQELELTPLSKIDDSSSSSSAAAANSTATQTDTITNTTKLPIPTVPPAPCEPKIMEDSLPNPSYDVSDITEEAAKQFAEFLVSKSLPTTVPSSEHYFQQPQQQPPPPSNQQVQQHSTSKAALEDIRKHADHLANAALSQDENILAFALASPIIHIAVVRFRDNITIPPQEAHSKTFLAPYWRELGLAWNSTENAQAWGSPFRDCNAIKNRWLWPFRMSITELGYKIVATAFIAADVDLCNDDLVQIFGRKHGCDRDTTFCLMTEYQASTTRDVYTCLCRDSFYLPNSTLQGFKADQVENISGKVTDIDGNFSCIPCPGGCFSCDQYGVCLLLGGDQFDVSFETLFKVTICTSLGACMLSCIVLAIFVFKQRKCKAIATGMWTVLEHILLGILLLYTSVALHFLPASTIRCLLEPWCREIGFMTCYGAIILKLYRHLVEFRTRKAHRWVLRDVDLLKYLFTMVFAVVCYMSAFTASSIDLIENASMLGLQESQTNTCVSLKWEYVTQVSEILILCFGLHLAFACRNATTQFRERQFLVAALTIEFIVSASFYTLRIIYLPELSPGAIFLALFIRSQLTNTITLVLIFFPKLWYQHKQVRSLAHDQSLRLPVDAFKGSHDTGHHLGGGYAGLCLGDPDIGELTISEMSPEDIRAELKRLYTQLELMKNKTLRQDNPHISKRRGGRKAGHRRFSLQKKGSKDKSINAKNRNKHHDIEITEAEPSRTPEDSVCSVEGPTDTCAEVSGISHSMLSHSALSHSAVSHSK